MLEIRCWSYSWECFHAFISDHSAPEAEWIGLVRCLRIPKTTTTSNSLHFLHYHRNIELPLRQGGRAGDAPFALWSVVGGAAGSYLPPTHVLISSSCVCLHRYLNNHYSVVVVGGDCDVVPSSCANPFHWWSSDHGRRHSVPLGGQFDSALK